MLEDVESRPPYFAPIITNQYGSIPVPRLEPGDCGGGSGGGCSCHKMKPVLRGLDGSFASDNAAANGDPMLLSSSSSSSSSSSADDAMLCGDCDDSSSSAAASSSLSFSSSSSSSSSEKMVEVHVCAGTCENRLLRIECVGEDCCDASSSSSSSSTKSNDTKPRAKSSKDKWANCSVGPDCMNRQIGQRKGNVKVLPFMEGACGWGLKAMEDVKQGRLVREYVGEVLTEDMVTERMEYMQKHNPHDVNMYVMELENGLFLDARNRGNVSRFINHGCDPNW